VQLPGFLIDLGFLDGHSLVLAKMLRPGGDRVFQAEQAGLFEGFRRAGTGRRRCAGMSPELPASNPEFVAIRAGDGVIDRYGDRAVVVVGTVKLVPVIERGGVDDGFGGEVE
jgi:hypothetical protein